VKKIVVLASVVVVCVGIASPSFASKRSRNKVQQPIQTVQAKDSGMYVKAEGGYGIPNVFNDFGTINDVIDIYKNNRLKGAFLGDVGFGYQLNSVVRLDLTVNYFGNARLEGVNLIAGGQESSHRERFKQSVRSVSGLGNVYIGANLDSKNVAFVTAGIGYSNNRAGDVSAMYDVGSAWQLLPNTGRSNSGLAYSVGLGFGRRVKDNVFLEGSYRYMNFGHINQGINEMAGVTAETRKMTAGSAAILQLQVFTVGLRILF